MESPRRNRPIAALHSDGPWSLHCCTALIAAVIIKRPRLSGIAVVLRVVAVNGDAVSPEKDSCLCGVSLRADYDEPKSPVERFPGCREGPFGNLSTGGVGPRISGAVGFSCVLATGQLLARCVRRLI